MRNTILAVVVAVLGLFSMVSNSYAVEAEMLWEDIYPDTLMGMKYFFLQQNDTVATDSEGNVYFAGLIGSPPGWIIENHYYIRKYDTSGNLLWHRTYDSEYFAEHRLNQVFLETDSQDNLYFAGRYTYYPEPGTKIERDVVLKYSPDGDLLWEYVPQTPESYLRVFNVVGLGLDSAGNAYLLSEVGAISGWGYRIDKVAPDGTPLWSDLRTSNGYSPPYDFSYYPLILTVRPDGNVLVTMREGRMATYDPSGAFTLLGVALSYPENQIQSVAVDPFGNIYTAFTTLVPGQYGSLDLGEPFLAKFDQGGNLLWLNDVLFSGPSHSEIELAPDGNLVLASSGAERNTSYEPNSAEPAIVSEYDPSGDLLWSQSVETGTYRDFTSTVIDPEGNIFMTGSVYIDGKIKPYAMKIGPSGDILWESIGDIAALYGYPFKNLHYFSRSSAIDISGNLVVSGYISDYPDAPGIGVYRRVSHFVAKFGPTNSPPIADAGADQSYECGSTAILNGSGSYDPDGDALTYTWTGPFESITGVTAEVDLPQGTQTVTLTVDDGNGGTSSDDVIITIIDTTPPVLSVTLSGNDLEPGLYLSDVLFEMSAADSCSGVTSVSYTLDGLQTIVTGSYASEIISSGGEHIIVFDATDNAGNTSAPQSLSFTLFEASADGLSDLTDYFLSEGLIGEQMGTSLKQQADKGSYGAFINHVEAQSGKKIDPSTAQILIEAAQYIMGQ